MKQAASRTTNSRSAQPTLVVGTIALTFLDTTWRIAVPVILFTLVGIWADLRFGTKPWLTFLGVLIGFGLAVMLVRRQLEAVQRMEEHK